MDARVLATSEFINQEKQALRLIQASMTVNPEFKPSLIRD
jgi:hypothetical protein